MLTGQDFKIESLSEPLVDVDVSENGSWRGITKSRVVSDLFQFEMPIKPRFPSIRILDDERSLVVDSRTAGTTDNAFILNRDGAILNSFYPGDAIQDVVVCEDYIVTTYFDEAFGGTGVESNGLSVFDYDGRFIFGYLSHFGSDAVDLFDCYACTKIGKNKIAFYCYTEFPLVFLDIAERTQHIFQPPARVAGSHALTKAGNRTYFHGPYDDKRGVYEWTLNADHAVRIGEYGSHLRGLPGGKFVAFGTSGYSLVTMVD